MFARDFTYYWKKIAESEITCGTIMMEAAQQEDKWWPIGLDVKSTTPLDDVEEVGYVHVVRAAFSSGRITRESHSTKYEQCNNDIFNKCITNPGGSGDVKILGANDDYDIRSGALVGLSLIRLRAREFSGWFGVKDKTDALRRQDKDVISLFPEWIERNGGSCALPIFLALLRFFCGVELQAKVAATGGLSLSGSILRVSNILNKIKAAVKVGAEIILVPMGNEEDVETADDFEGKERVRYVGFVTEVLELAVKGKFNASFRPSALDVIIIYGSNQVLLLLSFRLFEHKKPIG